ncbi:MAG: single-stranded DNA-binding protein [Deltaproteobacteria bacterium]|nr:MAG: single-stranded DNA-binding protein [Deltaproteobacteria bacterium]
MSDRPAAEALVEVARTLRDATADLSFGVKVAYVYAPLVYAWDVHAAYLRRYGGRRGVALAVGMNPGPFGMAQTGVPFGEVRAVRSFLGLDGTIGRPPREHPKRPVLGFACPRSEVSGRRLWGLAERCFGRPDPFFDRFFVANYCPLLFLDEGGRNVTPDKLPRAAAAACFAACDEALRRTVEIVEPRALVGVGKFAEARLQKVFGDRDIPIASVLHPSPANPRANRGWAEIARAQLAEFGLCEG